MSRETHEGVDIRRANGTTLRPGRFVGRASNYVSYFGAATAASFDVGRPDVVVSLTDPPIVGLAALWTARRAGARFVFLCEDVFPEVATLLEDFQIRTINAALDRINWHRFGSADGIVALGDRCAAASSKEGRRSGSGSCHHNWADCDAIVPDRRTTRFHANTALRIASS